MTSTTLDLDGALKGLFKDRDWPFKIMVGGFINCVAIGLLRVNLGFVPVAVSLWGLSYGYLLRAMRRSIKGELEGLPGWGDFIDLLVSGLSWLSICLGFGFFTLSVLAFSLIAAGNSSLLNLNNPNFLPWAAGTFLAVYLLFFSFKFFLAVLMCNFAEDEKMLAGFAWRKVLTRIFRRPGAMLVTWLAGLTISFVAVFFPTISIIGALLVPFFGFLAEVIMVRMIGQVWADTRPEQA